ncbi:hypothetical protein B566_EDAN002702 [Ephemera danica]|nr:hypothetical protein B566_EDAN002702 [Ephemera danica]
MALIEPAMLGILVLSIVVQQVVCQTVPRVSQLAKETTGLRMERGLWFWLVVIISGCLRLADSLTSRIACVTPCSPACANGQKCYFPQKECHCPDGFGGPSCQNVITCPANEFHRGCADSCKVTCRARSMGETCTSKCVEGCACSASMARNDKGKCVPLENCPCYVDGVEIEDGFQRMNSTARAQNNSGNVNLWLRDEEQCLEKKEI